MSQVLQDIIEITISALIAAGGIGAVLVAVIKIIYNFMADKFWKDYDHKLALELDRRKELMAGKTHISKARFDAEFELYRKLSKSFSELVYTLNLLFPAGAIPNTENKRENGTNKAPGETRRSEEKDYDRFIEKFRAAQEIYFESLPFIDKDMANRYREILRYASGQDLEYLIWLNRDKIKITPEHEYEMIQNTKKATEVYNDLNDTLRNYLKDLEVI